MPNVDRFTTHLETLQIEYEKKVKGYLIVLSNYEAPFSLQKISSKKTMKPSPSNA